MFDCNYVLQESVVSRANQDGTVIIMKMDAGDTFFKINGVASEIWKELSNNKDINQITKDIISAYNIPEEEIKTDIKNFVETLLKKNLIRKV